MAALAIVGGALVAIPLAAAPQAAEALTGSEFDPGYIISDQNFFDTSTMSVGQVQDFLNAQVSSCSSGYVCLKDYTMATYDRAAVEPGHCSAYAGSGSESAASIIFKTAQACGINPQVLLVLLEKETGLITDTSPTDSTYRKAMGYGCPDTSSCDAAFYGFYNQVYKAAWQFRQYSNYPDRHYQIGNVSVGYHPNAACGATDVDIRNQATADLYNYTPYQPNSAALANLGGTGDGCSSYGNRNFWVYYSNWFGSPTGVTASPFGVVDSITASPGNFRVSGWAIDPDTSAPVAVHVYVGSVGTAFSADLVRNDVAAVYTGLGSNHGFDVTVPVTSEGPNTVCIYAINVGPGSNVQLGCRSITAMSGSPIGSIDGIKGVTGGVNVSGWALDPDSTDPIAVHLYVDSVGKAVSAGMSRPDIAAAYPAYGANHGYSDTLAASPGPHSVCAYAINTGIGGTTVLGCQNVVVPDSGSGVQDLGRAPIGALDAATVASDGVTVSGWAIDPDTTASIRVHIYVDAVGAAFMADKDRPDVGAVYPVYGGAHGYSEKIAVAPGSHRICAYGINTGAGGNTQLNCKDVVVPVATIPDLGRAPIGALDAATVASDGVTVSGWAIDPDTTAS
ncbi:hypothetical protein QN345_11155, partial [Cryobacterium sp. 10I1]